MSSSAASSSSAAYSSVFGGRLSLKTGLTRSIDKTKQRRLVDDRKKKNKKKKKKKKKKDKKDKNNKNNNNNKNNKNNKKKTKSKKKNKKKNQKIMEKDALESDSESCTSEDERQLESAYQDFMAHKNHENANEPRVIQLTRAEREFELAQQQKQAGVIQKRISKTYRQRIQEYNKYLEGLSEHHDIPRVGPG